MKPYLGRMKNPQTTSRTPRPRPRPTTKAVPIPETRVETQELRELLETHLLAMQALLEEQQRTLDLTLRTIDTVRADLQAELRALGDARAPWVTAMTEARALLFVALRELIVGDNDAGLSIHLKAQPKAEAADHPGLRPEAANMAAPGHGAGAEAR